MDFVNDLFTSSFLGISVGFVAYKLISRSIQQGQNSDIEDWYKDPSRWDE